MSKLADLVYQLMSLEDCLAVLAIEARIGEALTFSEYREIIAFLDEIDEKFFTETPVWIRLLAYRLACLLEPNNIEIRQRAIIGIRTFGPDWDSEAEKLEKEINSRFQ
jgi:hypothetical protein